MLRKAIFIAFNISFLLFVPALSSITACEGESICLPTPYEVPLLGCDSEDVIPGEYMVVLNAGYSLEQHKRTVGIDLSTSIYSADPYGSSRHGGGYSARFSNGTLAAVRSDGGVMLVECNRKLIVEFEPSFQRPQS